MQKMMLSMLIPALSIILVILVAGGLGIIFTVLEVTMHNEWGVVILGMALVVGVPGVAYLLERMYNEPEQDW